MLTRCKTHTHSNKLAAKLMQVRRGTDKQNGDVSDVRILRVLGPNKRIQSLVLAQRLGVYCNNQESKETPLRLVPCN